jgi:DNA topoisomerase-1
VHPDVVDAYLDGTLVTTLQQQVEKHLSRNAKLFRHEEVAVLRLLQQRLAGQKQRLSRQLKESLRRARGEHGRGGKNRREIERFGQILLR